MTFTYEYPRPSVTVDCIVFSANFIKKKLEILTIRRGNEPYKGCLALPGGFVNMDESLETAARRELQEETGAQVQLMEQLCTFGDVDRDPRGRVIAVAYFTLVKQCDVKGSDDAAEAMWLNVSDLLEKKDELAFDHHLIISTGLSRLQAKIRYAPIGFNLLPDEFTISDIQVLYEIILQKKLDAANFRKKILSMGILIQKGVEQNVNHRPAKIYSFDQVRYDYAVKNGFNFQI